MPNEVNCNINNNKNKRKLFILGLYAVVVIVGIATSLMVYTLAQSGSNNNMSSKLNPDKIAYDTTTSSWEESNEESNTTTSLTREALSPNKQITLIAQDVELEIAPGERVKTWTFNGTVPGPTLRFTEGENVTILFINNGTEGHTIHFHGNHNDINDGVSPVIEKGGNYTYKITAEPAGALMYHCHAHPTSHHIRMGMYGALIVDPKDKSVLQPAKEFVMVMSELNKTEYKNRDNITLETDYYLINGYHDQYLRHPLKINRGDTLRLYVINIGTTIPYPFHLHSTTFMAYPSGLLDNEPQHVQTIPIAPGDATIVEAKWKYNGTYLFHSHGIQEERGNMGQINVSDDEIPLTKSVSMFDDQYKLQKKLQYPTIINDTRDNASKVISMKFNRFDPMTTNITVGTTVTWINNEFSPHTVTSGTPEDPNAGQMFNSFPFTPSNPYMSLNDTFKYTFNSTGTFDYHCTVHANTMKGTIVVQ
jgi:FtsP/CotA-like multicopper oxidase with cupredoxin domain